MADINLRIVGTADMRQIQEAINSLKASLAGLQAQYTSTGSTPLFKGIRGSIAEFNQLQEATGNFKVHMLEAGTAADRLSERIRTNKTNYKDLHMAMQSVNKQGNLFLELGRKQVAMQQAQAITIGKNTYVYESLNKTFADTTSRVRAMSIAIAYQNKVLREHAMNIVNTGKQMQWTGRQLAMGITTPLVMFGSQVGKIFNEVDKNLTRLAKVYGVGLEQPTQAVLARVRKDVLALSNELGKSLGISSAEVTDIAAQFAAAGMQGKELINSTRQAARAVVLGEADKQEAINATISLQTAYGLNTKQLTEAINFFNAAQAATSTSMGDLINAIPRVGPIIKNLGGSYKDMVAILTALKEGGVPAGEAANAIKNSLTRIIAPTEAAKKSLKGLGIDLESIVKKNAGNLTATLTELQSGLKGLDNISKQKAITDLFGRYQSARMTAFIENFNKQGSQSAKITEMMGKNAESLANIADAQTKKIQQSASGRFKIAVESMKNELIPFGEMFLDIFSTVAEKIIEVSKAIKELPSGIKTAIKIIAGITALIGPATYFYGLFRSMAGQILQAAVRVKTFVGAFRQLFTGGGIEGFRNIWKGFDETDLIAQAATNSVELFEAKINGIPKAADIFEMGIERMINSLQALSAQANSTSASVNDMYASTSANAVSTMPPGMRLPYTGANISSGRLQGVGFHHLSDLAETNKFLGIDDSGRSRGKRSNDQVYGLINITPSSLSGPEFQQAAGMAKNLVYSDETEKLRTQQIIDAYLRQNPNVTPEMRSQATSTLPVSLQQFASNAATMPAQLEAISKAGTAAVQRFNAEMQKIVSAFNTQDVSTSVAQIDALVKSIISAGGQEAEYAQKRRQNMERIIRAYETGGKTAADAVIIEIEKEARSISAGAGLVGTAYGKGDGRGGGVRAGLLALTTQLSNIVEEVIIPSVLEPFNFTAGKGLAEIQAEAKAQGRQLKEFVASNGKRYIADVTDGIEKAVLAELSASGVISGNAVPLSVRGQLGNIENLGTNKAALDRAARLKQLREAAQQNKLTSGIEALGPNRESFDRAEQLRLKRREIIDAKIAADIADVRSKRLEEEKKAEEIQRRAQDNKARNEKMARVARGLGTAGFAATSVLQMAGTGNETLNLIGQGISSASMLTGLVAGPWGIALQAVVAAMPLLIKGVSQLIDDSSKLGRAMSGAFKVSAFEADNLGIKVNELGKAVLPQIGEGVAEASSKIDALSKEIAALGDEDPLKMFANSLKSQEVANQIELLQQKYLTLRIQGVNDDDARNFVKAIMRAAGVEMSAGFGVNKFMAANNNQSVAAMVGAQARSMVNMTQRSQSFFDAGDASQYFKQFAEQGLGMGPTYDNPFGTWGPAADAARKSVEALTQSTYDLLLNTPKSKLDQTLKNIRIEMDKSKDTANLYTAAIRELYQQSGPTMQKYWEVVKGAGLNSAQQLKIANIYFNGLIKNINDLKYLTSNPIEIEVRTKFIEQKENVAKATSGLASKLSAAATSQTYQAEGKSLGLTSQKSDAQQALNDKLQEEIDLRKKLLDAQLKELEYSNSRASLQQEYNAALATNDLAKAADIQRQMNYEQVKYNTEMAKSALDDKAAKSQKKAAAAQQAINNTASSAKGAIEKISDYSDGAMKLVYDALANNGKLASTELNKFAKELKDKFGVPIATTKEAIKETLKQFQAQDVIQFATASASAFNTKWIPAQRKSAILAAFNNALQSSPSPESAMARAIQTVMSAQYGGASVRATTTANGGTAYIMTMPTGRGSYAVNISTEGVVSNVSPTYSPTKNPPKAPRPGQKLNPNTQTSLSFPQRKSGGGHVSGPGTGTSDSIPAYLSNGEYVIKASSVQKYGKEVFDGLNAQKFQDGGPVYSPLFGIGGQKYSVGKGLTSQFKPSSGGVLGMMASDLWKLTDTDVLKALLSYAKDQPLDMVREMLGISSANRLLHGQYTKDTRGTANSYWDLMGVLPLVGILSKAGKLGKLAKIAKPRLGIDTAAKIIPRAQNSRSVIVHDIAKQLGLKLNILPNSTAPILTEINQLWRSGGAAPFKMILEEMQRKQFFDMFDEVLLKNELDPLTNSQKQKILEQISSKSIDEVTEQKFSAMLHNAMSEAGVSKQQFSALNAPGGFRLTGISIKDLESRINSELSNTYRTEGYYKGRLTVIRLSDGKKVHIKPEDTETLQGISFDLLKKPAHMRAGKDRQHGHVYLTPTGENPNKLVNFSRSGRTSRSVQIAATVASMLAAHKFGLSPEALTMAGLVPGMIPDLAKAGKAGRAARIEAPILDIDSLKEVGLMEGSSRGKIYADQAGKKYYIKPSRSGVEAIRESKMAKLLRSFGMKTPNTYAQKINGKWHVISEELEGFVPMAQYGTEADRLALLNTPEFQRFIGKSDIFDEFIGDTDVRPANIMYNPNTSEFARVDFGKAFIGSPFLDQNRLQYMFSNISSKNRGLKFNRGPEYYKSATEALSIIKNLDPNKVAKMLDSRITGLPKIIEGRIDTFSNKVSARLAASRKAGKIAASISDIAKLKEGLRILKGDNKAARDALKSDTGFMGLLAKYGATTREPMDVYRSAVMSFDELQNLKVGDDLSIGGFQSFSTDEAAINTHVAMNDPLSGQNFNPPVRTDRGTFVYPKSREEWIKWWQEDLANQKKRVKTARRELSQAKRNMQPEISDDLFGTPIPRTARETAELERKLGIAQHNMTQARAKYKSLIASKSKFDKMTAVKYRIKTPQGVKYVDIDQLAKQFNLPYSYENEVAFTNAQLKITGIERHDSGAIIDAVMSNSSKVAKPKTAPITREEALEKLIVWQENMGQFNHADWPAIKEALGTFKSPSNRWQIHRGTNIEKLSNEILTPGIVEAIARGDFESVIGKKIVMRDSSFTDDFLQEAEFFNMPKSGQNNPQRVFISYNPTNESLLNIKSLLKGRKYTSTEKEIHVGSDFVKEIVDIQKYNPTHMRDASQNAIRIIIRDTDQLARKNAAVFDIDKTIIQTVSGVGKNWGKETLERGKPMPNQLAAILEAQKRGDQIIFLTARPDFMLPETLATLEKLGIKDFKLRMQSKELGDPRVAHEYKTKAIRELKKEYNITEAWDDEFANITALRKEGVNVKLPVITNEGHNPLSPNPPQKFASRPKVASDIIAPDMLAALPFVEKWVAGEMGIFRKKRFNLRTRKWEDNPKYSAEGAGALLGLMHNLPKGLSLSRRTILNPGVSGEMSAEVATKIIAAIRSGDLKSIIGDTVKFNDFASFTTVGGIKGAEGVHGTTVFAMRNEPVGISSIDAKKLGIDSFTTAVKQGFGRVVISGNNKPIGKHGFQDVEFILTTSGKEMGRDISASTRGRVTHLDEFLTHGVRGRITKVEAPVWPEPQYDKFGAKLTTGVSPHWKIYLQGYKDGGMVNLPKYHTGGYVNYSYGKEVAAMLQGGEVVIPKEIVRDIKQGAVSNNSVYNNTPNITINVAGTNATPEQIANAVSQAMQRRQNMVGSRTVIR